MKRLALLTILLVALASCVGSKTHSYLIRERFGVVVPEKVVFFSEPSLKSEHFQLDTAEEFAIEEVECGEYKKDGLCPYGFDENKYPNYIEKLFYKVRFDSGKRGYLNAGFIFIPELSRYIWGPRILMGNDNVFEINKDYLIVWNVVIDSIDELGFVIAQMRKEDGYIATYVKNKGGWRSKLSVRLSKQGDYVKITVNGTAEQYMQNKSDKADMPYWKEISDDFDEEELLNKIRKKFLMLSKQPNN